MLHACAPGAAVLDGAGFGDVAFQGAADKLLRQPRARDELLQVHPRLDPHLVQHVDQVLGGDVPAGTLRMRAAAQAAHGTVEDDHARLEAGQEIVPA